MSSENPHEHTLAWLEVHHHDLSAVICEGPFADVERDHDDLRNKLIAIHKQYNVHLPPASARGSNDPYLELVWMITGCEGRKTVNLPNGTPAFTLVWRLEFNADVAKAVKAATSKPVSLYTVREPSIPGIERTTLLPSVDAQIKPFAVSGGKHFNLGDKVTTFLTKEDAITHAKSLLPESSDDIVDKGFRRLKGISDASESAVVYGFVATKEYDLKRLVTVTKVAVTEDKREHPSV